MTKATCAAWMTRRTKTAVQAHRFEILTAVETPDIRRPAGCTALPGGCGEWFACEHVLSEHLLFNPGVGFFHAFAKLDGGLPVELFENFSVVAVAAVDAFGRAEIVGALEPDAGDLFNDVHELVDGDEFAGAEVEGLADVAFGDPPGAVGTIVDIHEGARLFAVAPDLDLIGTGVFGLDDFAADGGGSFFAAAGPGTEGTIDVVVAGYAALEPVVFFEVAAHPFGEEFFPAIAVFGKRRIGIL